MGEIRIVGPGKTRGYPYPVCKKTVHHSRVESDISVLYGVNSQADLRSDMPIRNSRVTLPLSAIAGGHTHSHSLMLVHD